MNYLVSGNSVTFENADETVSVCFSEGDDVAESGTVIPAGELAVAFSDSMGTVIVPFSEVLSAVTLTVPATFDVEIRALVNLVGAVALLLDLAANNA
jgi:hypothetical protein